MNRVTGQEYKARVEACAIICVDAMEEQRNEETGENALDRIMEAKKVDRATAGRMYINGTIRTMLRRGECTGYLEALEKIEFSQVEGRYTIPGTINKIGKAVARLQAMTGKDYRKCVNGQWEDVKPAKVTNGKSHAKNFGKVYGELYTQWQEREEDSDAETVYFSTIAERLGVHAEAHAREYMQEYASRLSKTGRAWLQYIKDADSIELGKASKESKDARRIENAIAYMVKNFPVKTVTTREYIDLVKRYA